MIIKVIDMKIITISIIKMIITLKSRVRAVSPVIPCNYPNGRFLADIVHTKCQPLLTTQTPLCRSGLPFNTMNCSWGSLCQPASLNINRKLFRNRLLHGRYFQALSFFLFLVKFSLIHSDKSSWHCYTQETVTSCYFAQSLNSHTHSSHCGSLIPYQCNWKQLTCNSCMYIIVL